MRYESKRKWCCAYWLTIRFCLSDGQIYRFLPKIHVRRYLIFVPPLKNECESNKGRFYKLVSMEGRVSILLGCICASRTVSFCFSFSHIARYAPSWKIITYGTIAANPSQANLKNLPKMSLEKNHVPLQIVVVLTWGQLIIQRIWNWTSNEKRDTVPII